MNDQEPENLPLIKACCEVLQEKKAIDVTVIHLGEISSITDYFIIATGNSEPHLRAMRNGIEGLLKAEKQHIGGIDYTPQSGWGIIDGGVFMVHFFLPEMRKLYNLEQLWSDGKVHEVEALLQNRKKENE